MNLLSLPQFRPLPFLSNPHVQTVIANVVHWSSDRIRPASHVAPLPDGDAIVLHETTPPEWRPGDCCVALVHGLGGCHNSPYMRRLTNHLAEAKLRVYRIDMRGAGAGASLAKRIYNADCSADIREAVAWIHRRNPESPIMVAGFSLGGNIVLKMAGEAGEHPLPGLAGVATVAAPIDLSACSRLIADYPFYDRFYVRRLKAQVRLHLRHNPDQPDPGLSRIQTLYQFDDLYTAPRGGFANVLDYYDRASSSLWVPRLRIPTFMLTAKDDPFIAWEPYAELPTMPNLEVHVAPRGGHLGFLGLDGNGGIRWAEAQVLKWILKRAIPDIGAM